MEVVAASPSGASGGIPPFQRRDVKEWSHLDSITGMLEHARVETDHWAANTHNTQHKYGKVVDSRDRRAPDGSQQQRQHRQLEVFQAQVPGGSLQVIRTQTVATSSSRWSSSTTSAAASASAGAKATAASATQPALHDFENLKLALNPLDLSSQKTKASVGRSGSIGGRRPPSRPRSIVGRLPDDGGAVTDRLQRVSRLCQQLHGESVTQTPPQKHHQTATQTKPCILERQNGDGSVSPDLFHLENNSSSTTTSNSSLTNDWKFSSGAKKNTPLFKTNNSLSKYSSNSDLDTDRRLNTALRGNNVDLEALDQILKSISSTNTYSLRNNVDEPERDIDLSSNSSSSTTENHTSSKVNSKRNSFITVESLQEVRGRLRRLSSPVDEYNFIPSNKAKITEKEEEPDDGIVAEDSLGSPTTMPTGSAISNALISSNTSNTTSGVSRVRSYVYGMEAMLHNGKKPFIGTGSLESRTSNKSNSSSTNRSEDWYNRRKSYGFEQVHNQQIDQSNSISLRGKNKIESSTDSGICRSTEIVVIPSVFKGQHSFNKLSSTENGTIYNKIGNNTVVSLNGDNNNKNKNSPVSIIDILSSENSTYNKPDSNELFSLWNRRASRNATEDKSSSKNDTEQTTITIPITTDDTSNPLVNRRLFHRQISDGTSMSIENWPNHKSPEHQDIKRHSIAVDETKYVTNNNKITIDSKYPFAQRRTSVGVTESINDYTTSNNIDLADEESPGNLNNKKQHKKVEFCKTEVHFAAESGRVNIVETDEKPPPTQNFRRRRRNSSVTSNHVPLEEFNKTGLPLIHFGDTTYEKKLFGVSDTENGTPNPLLPVNNSKPFDGLEQDNPSSINNGSSVMVSSVSINQDFEPDLREFGNDLPRSILKNKMAKPKPYLLGDSNNELLSRDVASSSEEKENSIWGVKLRPVQNKPDQESANVPIWRSTVTVQNTSYNVPAVPIVKEPLEQQKNHQAFTSIENKPAQEPEFQKLLYSLRPARKSEPCFTSPESTFERNPTTAVKKPVQPNYSNHSMDLRRSSWSVADRVKQVEDLRSDTNLKGYSTRVNFGSGETTVVENGDLESLAVKSRPQHEDKHIFDYSTIKPNTEPLRNTEPKIVINFNSNERKPSNSSIESLKGPKRIDNIKQAFEIDKNSVYTNGSYLSSPSLVGSSVHQKSIVNTKSGMILQDSKNLTKTIGTINNKLTKDSPSARRKNLYNQSTFTKRSASETHKKSDNLVGYLHQKQSPRVTKKLIDKQPKDIKQWKLQQNKPDLLQQFNESREYVNLTSVIKESKKLNANITTKKISEVKKDTKRIPSSKSLTRPDSPSVQRPESPIYENIDDVINDLQAMEKESTMLQELTRAADQILQAVNGYTDEDSKISTEDSEDEKNKHRIIKNLRKTGENLSTISETKSWKQVHSSKETAKNAKNIRNRVKPTSSTSSIESITREVQKPVPPVRLNRAVKLNEDKIKKKINDNSELVKITRARRLQRASSREALLQSQGSSSEDISNSIEILRKPRQVRKTKPFSSSTTEEISHNSSIKKSTISYTTSSLSSKKKEHESRRTSSDRVPIVGLPEIRHKTAVSTIKSTAEKAAHREKAMKAKSEEQRKKNLLKKDTTTSKGSNMLASSQHHAGGGAPGHRSTTASSTAREHGVSSSLAAIRTSSGVSSKKSTRSEGITKY